MELRLTAKKTYIFGSETIYAEDGFAIEDKVGFVKVNPKAFATPEQALEAAKKIKWKIETDDTGFGRLVRA